MLYLLPDFVIIGSMKSGTNSVASELRSHPNVFLPRGEVHFFDRHWERGVAWYADRFKNAADDCKVGEKTPRYVTRKQYMTRLHRVVPRCRLILLLRDPVRRLVSHINMHREVGRLPHFDRLTMEYLRVNILDGRHAFREYIERGFYADQIKNNIFPLFEWSQLLVRSTDEIAQAIDSAADERTSGKRVRIVDESFDKLMSGLCAFIEVEPMKKPSAWPSPVRFRHRLRRHRSFA